MKYWGLVPYILCTLRWPGNLCSQTVWATFFNLIDNISMQTRGVCVYWIMRLTGFYCTCSQRLVLDPVLFWPKFFAKNHNKIKAGRSTKTISVSLIAHQTYNACFPISKSFLKGWKTAMLRFKHSLYCANCFEFEKAKRTAAEHAKGEESMKKSCETGQEFLSYFLRCVQNIIFCKSSLAPIIETYTFHYFLWSVCTAHTILLCHNPWFHCTSRRRGWLVCKRTALDHCNCHKVLSNVDRHDGILAVCSLHCACIGQRSTRLWGEMMVEEMSWPKLVASMDWLRLSFRKNNMGLVRNQVELRTSLH